MRALSKLKTWLLRENGSASIEFITIMPLAMAILLASGEASMVSLRKTALDRALEMTVRELRQGQIANPTVADLRTRICNRLGMEEGCAENLTLELTVRSTSSTGIVSVPSLTNLCINRTTNVVPVLLFQPGAANDLVLVRACLVQDYFFPTTANQISLENQEGDEFRLIATTAFVNEPR
jgi:Flp pilus assembly protein TadG